MLRNMKVGTKLLAIVLPPLLVLVVVAGLGATDRRAEAADARTSEDFISLTSVSSDLIDELQRERSLSVLAVTDPEAVEGLDAQRTATDGAVTAFFDAADSTSLSAATAPLVDGTATRVAGDTSAMVTMRSSIDRGGLDPLIVHEWYVDTIAILLDLNTALSNEVPITDVSADLSSLVALDRSQEAYAKIQSMTTVALANDQFDVDGRQWRVFLAAINEARQYETLYYAISTPAQAAELRGLLESSTATDSAEFRTAVVDVVSQHIDWLNSGRDIDGTPNSISDGLADLDPPVEALSPMEWIEVSSALIDAHAEAGDVILADVADQVATIRSDVEQEALLYLVLTAVAIVFSIVLAIVVARRITKPLRSLTDAADRLSTEQLPALVERLKSPGASGGEVILEPINMRREDEIGHLADAFDAIQRVTVEVAEEQQTLLKKGIGDIFVNLARRNQSLLDRQIEFIDQLEQQEEDPDVLEDLFKLDHLATRMRRNAESLLVLAGVETTNRRSRPVSLADVVRVAVGEVEDFARLNLVSLDDAVVTGSAAMDVAHLLSELMENATAFSPPETSVEVLGHLNNDGTYVLSISDQGIGMSDEQFTDTNKLLAEPPLVGLTLSRSLGFTVVARLAARFAIDVRLTSSPTGGVTALVTLPRTILEETTITVEPDATPVVEEPVAAIEEITEQAPAEPAAVEWVAPVSFDEPELDEPAASYDDEVAAFHDQDDDAFADEPTPNEWVADAPAPSTLATAVPEGAAFDAGLAALMDEDTTSDNGSHNGASSAPEPASSVDGPSLFGGSDDVESAPQTAPTRTAAGLVKRVPRASTPASESQERPTGAAPVARTQRSPEEVRAMLSRYRSGLHRGRDGESTNGSSSLDGGN
jgi:signal transduction histidine kinase